MASRIQEEQFESADELWKELGSAKLSAESDAEIIFRGHANSNWDLVPTILRGEVATLLGNLFGRPMTCEDQAWVEFQMLRSFIGYCDNTGIAVPYDSIRFRESNLTDSAFSSYYDVPQSWPNDNLLEAMAMARLHGLPTRLLDWSTHPYVAAYFAASEALRSEWASGQRLAIIEFRKGEQFHPRMSPVKLVRVRGVISENVVAQHGLFTVFPIVGTNMDPVNKASLEEYLPPPPDSFIRKLTLPVEECVRLYELCHEFNLNAARIFPTADGASQSVMEAYRYSIRHPRDNIQ